jgi:hypothetical protein
MLDVGKCICEIQKRPPLYNSTLKDYSNRQLKAKCWTDTLHPRRNDTYISISCSFCCLLFAMEKKVDDEFGNKSFLLSFLPLMAGVPSELAIEARYKMTEVFRNISAGRQASLSAISPASASAASPVSIITNVSDISEEHFNILDFCHLQYS